MNDIEKFKDLIIEKLSNVKSEEEAIKLFTELKPQLEKLTEKFFPKVESDLDMEKDDIDWIYELNEYIANTIQLYLLYHVKGELKHIRLTLSIKNPPNIILTIGDQDYVIDYHKFKNGTDEKNRDAHRECYYRNESIWFEFQRFDACFNITTTGEELCNKLINVFPSVTVDYIID